MDCRASFSTLLVWSLAHKCTELSGARWSETEHNEFEEFFRTVFPNLFFELLGLASPILCFSSPNGVSAVQNERCSCQRTRGSEQGRMSVVRGSAMFSGAPGGAQHGPQTPGKPRRGQERPGVTSRAQGMPKNVQEHPGAPRSAQSAQERPGAPRSVFRSFSSEHARRTSLEQWFFDAFRMSMLEERSSSERAQRT